MDGFRLAETDPDARAVSLLEFLLNLWRGHPSRAPSLVDIALDVSQVSMVTPTLAEINPESSVISLPEFALDLWRGNPSSASSLISLVLDLWRRFPATSPLIHTPHTNVSLSNDIIGSSPTVHQFDTDVSAFADTDPDSRAVSAFDLGVDLWSRFQQIGHRSDLDESITYHREALNLRPEGHPCRSMSLSYLAVGLHTRFQQTEDKGDIDECIKYIFSLMTCPEPTGDRSDLYKGINDLREALDLFPKEHSGSAPSFADTNPGSRLALITGQG